MDNELAHESEWTKAKEALKEAFPVTIPIMAGFWFVAFAYGVYMNAEGFSFWYPTIMAAYIFGGSLEFITVSMLLSPFAPMTTFIVAFMVQARHMFYGLAMLDKYKNTGWKKPFLIYMMCDETFALNYSTTVPRNIDHTWYMFWISILDFIYWVSGAFLGGLLGSIITINLDGLSFVMTTMFVVIFLEQWLKEKQHYSSLIGLVAAIGSRLIFGADSFMLPAMAVIILLLTAARKPISKAGGIV